MYNLRRRLEKDTKAFKELTKKNAEALNKKDTIIERLGLSAEHLTKENALLNHKVVATEKKAKKRAFNSFITGLAIGAGAVLLEQHRAS